LGSYILGNDILKITDHVFTYSSKNPLPIQSIAKSLGTVPVLLPLR